jgi:MinD-like ATPase involved in chromosome partitioning or flagellar assembly
LPGWSDPGGRPGPSDPAGPPGQGSAPGGPADRNGPGGYRWETNYEPTDQYDSAGAYAPGRYSPPVYGAPDSYGPSADYDPADPYGPADAYGPDAYAPADLYGVPDPYRHPDIYGPPPPHAPGPPTAAPGPGALAPPQAGPGTVAPQGASSFPAAAPTGVPGAGAFAPPGTPLPPVTPAPQRAPGAQATTDPAAAGGPPVPSAEAGLDAPAGTAEPDVLQDDDPAAAPGGLTPDFLLPGRRRAPAPGWRRVIYRASGGLMRVPSTAAELRRRDMINRVRTPVAGGHHRVAVLSLKGGVGKTTTTVGLGATLASLRGDRVIAVDANPDRGTLSDKVRLETAATVRDLLNERGHIRRYADVRTFTSQAASRLEVLASDRDPTVSVAFGDQDYGMVARVLEHYYSICITDCGTGLLHSAMAGVLRLADQIVLVSSPSVDGARSASATLDWLAAHSYGDLVHNAVVVLSNVRQRSKSSVDLNRLEEHFASRCRAVIRIPHDPHLEEGAEVELDQLSRSTADAYLALAAVIGDGLAMPARARRV